MEQISMNVSSEVGELKTVIVHTPGCEVENMVPENKESALYSDIINLSIATEEHRQLKGVLEKFATVLEVRDLLKDVLKDDSVKEKILDELLALDGIPCLKKYLLSLDLDELAREIIEGVPVKRNTLTGFLDQQRFAMKPMHNLFFMRDPAMVAWNNTFIGQMASSVRSREAILMEYILKYHPNLNTSVVNVKKDVNHKKRATDLRLEGGDFLVAREDVLVIGLGMRSSSEGIDSVLEWIKTTDKKNCHVVVQQLPDHPESFIHLDMIFTFVDKNLCLIYEPQILGHQRLSTIDIEVKGGEVVDIQYKRNLMDALKELGFDLDYITCGGSDPWSMEREQWHSGANFFVIKPGVVIGYARNIHTIEQFEKKGYRIVHALDFISGKETIADTEKAVITIKGAELSRGGGGARCMTMPILRESVVW